MKRDAVAPCQTSFNTGMAWSVMAEVAECLGRLDREGLESAIDLRSLPLTEADRAQLEALLGQGEVTAHLEVAGHSIIRETAYPGVWWVRHMGAGDQVSSEELAITRLPDILVTDPGDIAAGVQRLRQQLMSGPDRASEPEQEASHA